ncbi:YidC/Oxa1 family membrane protein insertase [Zhenpiania hominis]|uniref:Membrane protein insertase YidC n=1 Tax=Zhenpiania hominis TaxID=2763644 RepID=A0A923NL75_9FIRM|nr:YidC/Oxa1 family membrane protein insertase [Zhenpiania hominis]MBC6680122.1 membrane protein insertase YidC [Zhenpiania hominis]
MYTILGVIAEPLGWLLSFLYGFINNYGITIIIFTIIVKMCLYPLYIKQTKSMARMSEVQPKMLALQRKYANDKETLNIKMAELYKEEKFNPMGGCLPMLIQMPIIMGLFALLRQPMEYMTNDDTMLFAVHEEFLWIMDLSQPDKWILPILAGIATFIAFSMNQQQQEEATGTAAQMNGMMKMMKYIFPIMIVWMGRSFPSGLALYWALGQIMQIFFNIHLKSVRNKLKEESKKKKK